MTTLVAEGRRRFSAVVNDATISVEERKLRLGKIIHEFEEQVSTILSPDQMKRVAEAQSRLGGRFPNEVGFLKGLNLPLTDEQRVAVKALIPEWEARVRAAATDARASLAARQEAVAGVDAWAHDRLAAILTADQRSAFAAAWKAAGEKKMKGQAVQSLELKGLPRGK